MPACMESLLLDGSTSLFDRSLSVPPAIAGSGAMRRAIGAIRQARMLPGPRREDTLRISWGSRAMLARKRRSKIGEG